MIHICEKCFQRPYRFAKERGIIWRVDVVPEDEGALCQIYQEEYAMVVVFRINPTATVARWK